MHEDSVGGVVIPSTLPPVTDIRRRSPTVDRSAARSAAGGRSVSACRAGLADPSGAFHRIDGEGPGSQSDGPAIGKVGRFSRS
jgi:hypothetical protein